MHPDRDVTEMLAELRRGEDHAMEGLLPLVIDQLHRLAEQHLNQECPGHTLQATALVHEAYLGLIREKDRNWDNRSHFLRVASLAMRRVLLHYAEKKSALKRGGDQARVEFDEALSLFEERATDLVALDEALERLQEIDDVKASIVELRFFGGLGVEETARVLGTSTRSVERGWRMARAWLRTQLEKE